MLWRQIHRKMSITNSSPKITTDIPGATCYERKYLLTACCLRLDHRGFKAWSDHRQTAHHLPVPLRHHPFTIYLSKYYKPASLRGPKWGCVVCLWSDCTPQWSTSPTLPLRDSWPYFFLQKNISCLHTFTFIQIKHEVFLESYKRK